MARPSVPEVIRKSLSKGYEINHDQRDGCWVVETPFDFRDGDHFVLVLKQDGPDWILTDEGHTLMHLSYSSELDEREMEYIRQVCRGRRVELSNGEFCIWFHPSMFGDALVQLLIAIAQAAAVEFLPGEAG